MAASSAPAASDKEYDSEVLSDDEGLSEAEVEDLVSGGNFIAKIEALLAENDTVPLSRKKEIHNYCEGLGTVFAAESPVEAFLAHPPDKDDVLCVKLHRSLDELRCTIEELKEELLFEAVDLVQKALTGHRLAGKAVTKRRRL
jgi:hypothetical protein